MYLSNLSDDEFTNIHPLEIKTMEQNTLYYYSISNEIMHKFRSNLYANVTEAILMLDEDNISTECYISPCVKNNINIYWYNCNLSNEIINKLKDKIKGYYQISQNIELEDYYENRQ